MSMRVILNSATMAAFAVATMVAMGPTKAVAEYPNDETILAVVPFGAGGGTDRWARVMSSVGFDFFGKGMKPTIMAPKGKPYDNWDGFIKHIKSGGKRLSIGGSMTLLLGVVGALKQLGLEDKVILGD